MTPRVQASRRLRYSISSRSQFDPHRSHSSSQGYFHHLAVSATPYLPGVALRPKDIFHLGMLCHLVIPELPLFQRLQSHTKQPWQQIIPYLRWQLRCLIFSTFVTCNATQHGQLWTMANFSACNPSNHGRYNESTRAYRAIAKITPVQSASMHTD